MIVSLNGIASAKEIPIHHDVQHLGLDQLARSDTLLLYINQSMLSSQVLQTA
jgi:hypothetical protein